MIVHQLFPTTVCQFHYPDCEQFNTLFIDTILDYYKDNGDTDVLLSGSGEMTKHVTIHKQPQYLPIFQFASECVRNYIRQLNCDDSVFDLQLVKTWLSTTGVPVPIHTHGDSHVAFSYYINLPTNIIRPIRFYSPNWVSINDLFDGLIAFNKPSDAAWNLSNSTSWRFEPAVGDLFVFPGKLRHDTEGFVEGESSIETTTTEELKQKRICLAGDFLLTHRETTNNAMGLQPIDNWVTF